MDDKQRVIRRLLGLCECTSQMEGRCDIYYLDSGYHCSRDVGHKGRHFACGMEHKFLEWD